MSYSNIICCTTLTYKFNHVSTFEKSVFDGFLDESRIGSCWATGSAGLCGGTKEAGAADGCTDIDFDKRCVWCLHI